MQRVHDVGIGLALARSSIAVVIDKEDDELVLFSDRRHIIAAVRGPHVKRRNFREERCIDPPKPLTDTRVAFGIAVAHLYEQRVWLYTEVVFPYRERVESMTWSSGWIDLDPRRWKRS